MFCTLCRGEATAHAAQIWTVCRPGQACQRPPIGEDSAGCNSVRMRGCACSYALAKANVMAARKTSAIPDQVFSVHKPGDNLCRTMANLCAAWGKGGRFSSCHACARPSSGATQSTPCVQEKSINHAQANPASSS